MIARASDCFYILYGELSVDTASQFLGLIGRISLSQGKVHTQCISLK